LDAVLEEYCNNVAAVAIDGAKAVGKTSSAKRLAKTTVSLDNRAARELMEAAPGTQLNAPKPVLVDEWQRLPEVWDLVRRQVDEDNTPGQYLLTGSSYSKGASIHSGAGRIVHVRMRPLSLAERGLEVPAVSLFALLNGKQNEVRGSTDVGLETYLEEIVRSGFPGIWQMSAKGAALQLDGYLENIVNKEFEEQGLIVRKPDILRNWLRGYASATGTTASYQAILDISTPGEADKPAKKTTRSYRDVLDALWITDRIDPWLPMGTMFKYVGKTPKHYLADPGLSARLLDITRDSLLQGIDHEPLGQQGKTVAGRLFEALVGLSLQTYALACEARLRHFRTTSGSHEVDFIIEKGKSLVAIEVKLSPTVEGNEVSHLKWLEETFKEYTVTKMIVNTGATAYKRKDGVLVVPAVLLGI
jgi:predicted AAA+ superfamily ATPase